MYVGSKARLAKYLAPIIQSYITKDTVGYLEPFVGGANMIMHIKHEKRYGSDISEELIDLLKYLQKDAIVIPDFISEDEYIKVKNNKNEYPSWKVGLVGYCATFGSKYFGGYARRNDNACTIRSQLNNLKRQKPFLKGINFKCLNYQEIKQLKNFVIYCDPPYKNSTGYRNKFDTDLFFDWVRNYSQNNIVLVSEYTAPKDFSCIFEKEQFVNISGKKEVKSIERLFKWKD